MIAAWRIQWLDGITGYGLHLGAIAYCTMTKRNAQLSHRVDAELNLGANRIARRDSQSRAIIQYEVIAGKRLAPSNDHFLAQPMA